MGDEEIIYSDDYTRVVNYQSRQFTLGDISLAAINGLQWNALPPAVGIGCATAIPSALLMWIVGISPVWAVLIPPIPAVIIYLRRAKERQGGLSEREKRLLRNNHRRQPRHLLGLVEDKEPTSFCWQVILHTPAPTTTPRRKRNPTP